MTLKVPSSRKHNALNGAKRQHYADEQGSGENVEASYFWRDWDNQQETATADHEDQMAHDVAEVIQQDPNQGHYGTFQMQFYNGGATDDCGYTFFHPIDYSFHEGETEGYLNNYCG